MANEVRYKHPTGIKTMEADFANLLPDDSALTLVNCDVTAIDSEGEDVSADLISDVAVSGLVLSAKINEGDDGEDYLVTFLGYGTTSNNLENYTIEVRIRSKIDGTV